MNANRMTEAEAAGKWCPFARVVAARNDTPVNRERTQIGATALNTTCIGARCMAWRWAEMPKPALLSCVELAVGEGPPDLLGGWTVTDSGIDEPAEDESQGPYAWEAWSKQMQDAKPGRGYCGLAGEPR